MLNNVGEKTTLTNSYFIKPGWKLT